MTKVLCLHGCNQTKSMYESILKSLVKIGTKSHDLEFFFIEAEYEHPLGGFTWYNRPLEVKDIGSIEYDDDLVRSCMDQIQRAIDELDIDVLVGFSQGGNVVDTYLATHEDTRIKRAIIFSGYELNNKDRQTVKIPTLSVYSEEDTVVESKHRPSHYEILSEFKHEKGHKHPTGNPLQRSFCEFIKGNGMIGFDIQKNGERG